MPIFDLERRYRDIWVVLDRAHRVIDSGERLDLLRRKHGAQARRTFCLVSGPGEALAAPPAPAPWSLRQMLGHGPA
jgi:hypothetical protein